MLYSVRGKPHLSIGKVKVNQWKHQLNLRVHGLLPQKHMLYQMGQPILFSRLIQIQVTYYLMNYITELLIARLINYYLLLTLMVQIMYIRVKRLDIGKLHLGSLIVITIKHYSIILAMYQIILVVLLLLIHPHHQQRIHILIIAQQ